MLDGAGALGSLSNDLSRVMSDAAHLQIAAVQQDVAQIGKDVGNILSQVGSSTAIDLVRDAGTVLYGSLYTQIGGSLVLAGFESSELGVGIPLAFAGSSLFTFGANLQLTGAQKLVTDFNRLLAGGPQQQPSSSEANSTLSSPSTPTETIGYIDE